MRYHGYREEIRKHISERGFEVGIGSSSPPVLEYLARLVGAPDVRLIGEVGFNIGISSYGFLTANPEARVISFDLGTQDYVSVAKEYIDSKFPGRHTLIIGDSKETVPRFQRENPETRFDFAFIDGGHDYETAMADIVNMKPLSHERTAVVMDDLTPWVLYGEGPTRAWTDAIRDGLVVQEELIKDGNSVEEVARPGERIWALGRYVYP